MSMWMKSLTVVWLPALSVTVHEICWIPSIDGWSCSLWIVAAGAKILNESSVESSKQMSDASPPWSAASSWMAGSVVFQGGLPLGVGSVSDSCGADVSPAT